MPFLQKDDFLLILSILSKIFFLNLQQSCTPIEDNGMRHHDEVPVGTFDNSPVIYCREMMNGWNKVP
jgi:hypothetical protein